MPLFIANGIKITQTTFKDVIYITFTWNYVIPTTNNKPNFVIELNQ